MTYLKDHYSYRGKLAAPTLRRLADLRSYYGIVRLNLDEERNQVCVEYDASRLKESDVLHLLRLAGLEVTEKVDLSSAA